MNENEKENSGQNAVAPDSRRLLASPRAMLAAEEILYRWERERERAPLDRIVQAELRGRRYLNSSERRWVGDAVFGCVRFWRRHGFLLDKSGQAQGVRQRVEMWADAPVSADAEAPAAADGLPGIDQPSEHLRETLSFPDPMADELEALLGPEAIAAAEAFNRPAPTILRVNTLRTTRRRVLARIPGSRPTAFSPWGVELPGRVNLDELPGFRDGWFEVQEEASQLAALLADSVPGQTIIDIGAGAGGKSLAMASMMRNDGVVVAADSSQDRLDKLVVRAQRAGVKIIQRLKLHANAEGVWQLSAAQQRTVDKLRATANCVFVDAPCTGSGVLRRSPDGRWRTNDLDGFARLQGLLLEQSAGFVAPSGSMVYVTCAFERAQNEEVVERYLASRAGADFVVVPALDRLRRAWNRAAKMYSPHEQEPPGGLDTLASLMSGPFLRTWPHRYNLDAFFAACLERKS